MSEEQPVATETVSEETTQEASTTLTDEGALIAESKKYRKRSQDAEAERDTYKAQLASAEEAKLKKQGKYQTLYEEAQAKMVTLESNAEKWTGYETSRRTALLESVPEDERESLSKLDFETLEYVTNKINQTKANVPEVVGSPRQPEKPLGDWTQMSKQDKKDNWNTIIANAKNRK
jgi:hypothetical protein